MTTTETTDSRLLHSGMTTKANDRSRIKTLRDDDLTTHFRTLNIFYTTARGFTLIELLVVVLIIGILASVALPEYNKAVEKSRAAEAINVVRAIKVANEAYFMANGSYSNDLNDLDIQIPGKDGNYNSVPRKESSLFSFAASANVGGVGNVVALGNRFPLATKYIIFALPNRDNFYCKFYGPEGETLCKSLGSTKYSSQVYVVN